MELLQWNLVFLFLLPQIANLGAAHFIFSGIAAFCIFVFHQKATEKQFIPYSQQK